VLREEREKLSEKREIWMECGGQMNKKMGRRRTTERVVPAGGSTQY